MTVLYVILLCACIYFSIGPIIMVLYTFLYRRGVKDFTDTLIWITYKLKNDIPMMTNRKEVFRYLQQAQKVVGNWRIFIAFIFACSFHPKIIFNVIIYDIYFRKERSQ